LFCLTWDWPDNDATVTGTFHRTGLEPGPAAVHLTFEHELGTAGIGHWIIGRPRESERPPILQEW
jgi:hypothetical protein